MTATFLPVRGFALGTCTWSAGLWSTAYFFSPRMLMASSMRFRRQRSSQGCSQIMAQADKDAKSIREEAQKQASVIIENAKQEAQEEKRRQLEAMHDQVMELSVALASRILEREIKPEDHQKLMEEFLSEVK